MVRTKEDDLIELAAQAGKESGTAKERVSVGAVFLEPEPGGINQQGDDPGFETRVKSPTGGKPPGRPVADSKDRKPVGRPRGSATERTAEEIKEAVERKFNEFFGVVTLSLPITGTYGVENSDKAVAALISIGKRRPAVMKMLMRLADGADGMDIGRYVAGVMVAVQVDLGRIPGDSVAAKATGVTEVIKKYFIEEESPVNPNVTEQTINARFQPVS